MYFVNLCLIRLFINILLLILFIWTIYKIGKGEGRRELKSDPLMKDDYLNVVSVVNFLLG